MIEIFTLTSGNRPETLMVSADSAVKSMSKNDVHTVITCTDPSRIEEIKRSALIESKADWVLFLDDDDALVEGALEKCKNIAESSDVGVVFAEQACVKQQGLLNVEEHTIRSTISYSDICVQPLGMHGLVLLNTRKAITDFKSADVSNSVGYEWAFKAATAIVHGAVYVPTLGYMWTQHQSQQHREANQLSSYMKNRLDITKYLNSLVSDKTDTLIPTYKLN